MGNMGCIVQRVALAAFALQLIATVTAEEPFAGWQGATFDSNNVFSKKDAQSSLHHAETGIQVLSWKPRSFYWPGFITEEEADVLVKLAKPRMMRSTVVGGNGGGVVDGIRTSYGAFLRRHGHPVVTSLERKLSAWTHLNISHQEDVQILRYGVGQQYRAHMDTLMNGSPRVCTALVYLHDTEEGGETAFPNSNHWADQGLRSRLGPFSPCAEGHVAVKLRKGDAMLFYTFGPDGVEDPLALHTGCPVLRGTKWTATVWIHAAPFRPEDLEGGEPPAEPDWDPGSCDNSHPSCESWASSGECTANPGYMLGADGSVGHCRLACKACEVCAEEDGACRARNRMAAGYLPLDEAEM